MKQATLPSSPLDGMIVHRRVTPKLRRLYPLIQHLVGKGQVFEFKLVRIQEAGQPVIEIILDTLY